MRELGSFLSNAHQRLAAWGSSIRHSLSIFNRQRVLHERTFQIGRFNHLLVVAALVMAAFCLGLLVMGLVQSGDQASQSASKALPGAVGQPAQDFTSQDDKPIHNWRVCADLGVGPVPGLNEPRQRFKLCHPKGWEVLAYCVEPNIPAPPIGRICSRTGEFAFSCGVGVQRLREYEIQVTPTPVLQETPTPTATQTSTATATPTITPSATASAAATATRSIATASPTPPTQTLSALDTPTPRPRPGGIGNMENIANQGLLSAAGLLLAAAGILIWISKLIGSGHKNR
jgi:hypothetical protein